MSESLRTTPEIHKDFTRLAGKWEMKNIEFLRSMVNYFKVTKTDPTDTDFEKTSSAVKELRKTFMGYMTVHEQKLKKELAPLIDFQEQIYKKVEMSEHKIKTEIQLAAKGTTELKLPDGFLEPEVITDPETQLELDEANKKIAELERQLSLKNELPSTAGVKQIQDDKFAFRDLKIDFPKTHNHPPPGKSIMYKNYTELFNAHEKLLTQLHKKKG